MSLGRNTLDTRLGRMCSLAEIEGHITNHSMHATPITQMYATGVPKELDTDHLKTSVSMKGLTASSTKWFQMFFLIQRRNAIIYNKLRRV